MGRRSDLFIPKITKESIETSWGQHFPKCNNIRKRTHAFWNYCRHISKGEYVGLGVIHRGHLKQGRLLMASYLSQNGSGGGSHYSEGVSTVVQMAYHELLIPWVLERAMPIADLVKTTLGTKGMVGMLHDMDALAKMVDPPDELDRLLVWFVLSFEHVGDDVDFRH
nr:26S proteasome regulatory complex component [Tanacetum cinerariifolium]